MHRTSKHLYAAALACVLALSFQASPAIAGEASSAVTIMRSDDRIEEMVPVEEESDEGSGGQGGFGARPLAKTGDDNLMLAAGLAAAGAVLAARGIYVPGRGRDQDEEEDEEK